MSEAEFEKTYETANVASKQIDEGKPPLGAKPYYVAISQRIKELTDAIERQVDYYPVVDEDTSALINIWAAEISLLCEMQDKLSKRGI